MITFLIISSNQINLLKQRLFLYNKIAKQTNSEIIVVDDGSTDNTGAYVNTHYPNIRFMKNKTEEGYIKSFNKTIDFVTTPYLLCIDLHLEIKSLCIKSEIKKIRQTNSFVHFITHTNKSNYENKLLYLDSSKVEFKVRSTSLIDKNYALTEVLIFDKNKIITLGRLSQHYFGIRFTFFDLIFKGLKLGYTSSISTSNFIIKKENLDTFFSYPIDSWTEFKDNLIFQWKYCNSVSYKLKRYTYILINCLYFKPRKLKQITQAYTKWFFSKKEKLNWEVLKDSEILNNKIKTQKSTLLNSILNIKEYNTLYILNKNPINNLYLNELNTLFPSLKIKQTSTLPKDGLIISLNKQVPKSNFIKNHCIYISKNKPKQSVKLYLKSPSNKPEDLIIALLEWANQKPYCAHKTIFFTNNKKNWQLESNKNIIPIKFSILHLIKKWNTHYFSIDATNNTFMITIIKFINQILKLFFIEKQIYLIKTPYDLIYQKALSKN